MEPRAPVGSTQCPQDGNERYGAFRVGSHDDLATALGLAVLRDPAPWSRPASAEDIRRVMEGDYGDYGDPWGGGGDPYG